MSYRNKTSRMSMLTILFFIAAVVLGAFLLDCKKKSEGLVAELAKAKELAAEISTGDSSDTAVENYATRSGRLGTNPMQMQRIYREAKPALHPPTSYKQAGLFDLPQDNRRVVQRPLPPRPNVTKREYEYLNAERKVAPPRVLAPAEKQARKAASAVSQGPVVTPPAARKAAPQRVARKMATVQLQDCPSCVNEHEKCPDGCKCDSCEYTKIGDGDDAPYVFVDEFLGSPLGGVGSAVLTDLRHNTSDMIRPPVEVSSIHHGNGDDDDRWFVPAQYGRAPAPSAYKHIM